MYQKASISSLSYRRLSSSANSIFAFTIDTLSEYTSINHWFSSLDFDIKKQLLDGSLDIHDLLADLSFNSLPSRKDL